jgi:uncharacterized protein YyaL (SSP411 family)
MMTKNTWLLYSLLLLGNFSCAQSPGKVSPTIGEGGYAYTNELIHESSPYLLEHAHNPVNWLPWGEKALQKAKAEHKMILVSVGYAACHWCHVMAKENFEDTVVASFMNSHFVCIKVDREERPDVDEVYLKAAELLTGDAGWPNNVLALPDGRPFYACTYFPRKSWMEMLKYFVQIDRTKEDVLEKQARDVTEGLHTNEGVTFHAPAPASITAADLHKDFEQLKADLDFSKGGGRSGTKFPMPTAWEYLLHLYFITHDQEALDAVNITLHHMACGGIYDQLGGGFARYSTDPDWHLPHFEKMLYDNAQLVQLYSEAYQLTRDPLYKSVVYQTIAMIQRTFTSPEGGFYSSLDADSEGKEGKYYVWTKAEADKTLGEHAALFDEVYHITGRGNWVNGENILYTSGAIDSLAPKYQLSASTMASILDESRAALLRVRDSRVKPALDDKILTSWNALMLRGYVAAYRAFGDTSFLSAALTSARFLLNHAGGSFPALTRNYKGGKSSVPGLLDDYAFTISAFIELYQATFDEQWLSRARTLTDYTRTEFYDSASGMFFYTDRESSDLIARQMEIQDNVIPSSNSEMANNLFLLGNYYNKEEYLGMARQMLNNVASQVHKQTFYYANWGMLEELSAVPLYEVAVVGENFQDKCREWDQHYQPNAILMGGRTEGTLELLANKLVPGQTTIYVCTNRVCKFPVTDVARAIQQIPK